MLSCAKNVSLYSIMTVSCCTVQDCAAKADAVCVSAAVSWSVYFVSFLLSCVFLYYSVTLPAVLLASCYYHNLFAKTSLNTRLRCRPLEAFATDARIIPLIS